MKIPFDPPPTIDIHLMAIQTDRLEWVGDDGYYLMQAHIENGDFNREKKNKVQLKVIAANAGPAALSFGGLVIFSNMNNTVIRKALLSGLDYLLRTGQLSKEDFHVVADEKTDSNPPEK